MADSSKIIIGKTVIKKCKCKRCKSDKNYRKHDRSYFQGRTLKENELIIFNQNEKSKDYGGSLEWNWINCDPNNDHCRILYS